MQNQGKKKKKKKIGVSVQSVVGTVTVQRCSLHAFVHIGE